MESMLITVKMGIAIVQMSLEDVWTQAIPAMKYHGINMKPSVDVGKIKRRVKNMSYAITEIV